MKIDETNPLVMFFVNWIKHYNHKKYWKRRSEVIDPNSKYPKFVRLYWLFYIKKCDSYNNASMGTGFGGVQHLLNHRFFRIY